MTATPQPSRAMAPRTLGPRTLGIVWCCVSALCYGLLGPFGVVILGHGMPQNAMIAWRFLIAASVLWLLVATLRRPVGRGRQVWQPFLMGALVYAVQTSLYFVSVRHLSAGMAALLLYTMPVLVVIVSIARRTQVLSARVLMALVLAVGGVGLALVGPDVPFSLVGILCGLGSAVAYTVYYFGMDTLPAHTDRLTASTLVCSGAATSVTVTALVTGSFALPRAAAWPWLAAMGVVCTVVAIALLMIGIAAAGPSTASVVSCLEPIAAVLLGAAFLGEAFGPPRWIGTLAVVGAVLLLSAPARRRIPGLTTGPHQ
ncbi:DMT family transporter [Mariniluteicoccus flavus]